MQFLRTFLSLGAATMLAVACASSNKEPTETPTQSEQAQTSETQPQTSATKPAVKPIPDGFYTITLSLTVPDVDQAIEFYKKALAATEVMRLAGPDGKTMHGEIRIGDSMVMLGVEDKEHGMVAPTSLGGVSTSVQLYVQDVDSAFKAAVDAGATPMMPVADMFWGDRHGVVVDPFGHKWGISTHKADLTIEQIQQAAAESFAEEAKKSKKKSKSNKPKPVSYPPEAMATAKPIPDGMHTVNPHLVIQGAAQAIEFYKRNFGAEEIERMPGPDGRIMHAMLKIGDSMVMLSDEYPEWDSKSPTTLKGTAAALMIYVPNVDASFAQAVNDKATAQMPVTDMFWGDRYGELTDPFGHRWGIATHKEDLTPEQISERMKAQFGSES